MVDFWKNFREYLKFYGINLQIYDLVSNWPFPKQAARDDEIRFFDGRRRSV